MNQPDKNIVRQTLRDHRVCVVIPTYNNSKTVENVVRETLRYCDDVIVVNDGSTDNTSSILAAIKGIDIVDCPRNGGKGAALKHGFRRALERGFDYAITLDSDGQHYPADIPDFARAIVEHPGALVVGERDLSRVDINGKSSFANKFSNFWFRVQTWKKLRDTQTGYRAYPLRRLSGLGLLTSRYEAELELLVFAAWAGVELLPIPIRVYYPPRNERVSHFRPALDFTRISILNTILCAGAVAYGAPRGIWNAISKKKIFSRNFRPFTHNRKGKRREAALTYQRLWNSFYGFSYFAICAGLIFTPIADIRFAFRKNLEKNRRWIHNLIQKFSAHIVRNFPACSMEYQNPHGEKLEKPALIISNHQSLLDLPLLMGMTPKLIFLTNDWVWNSPVFGRLIRHAEFLPVSSGIDTIMPHLRELRDRGYSIVVFPEGTRSETGHILRFHQGAFALADALEMDILPVVIHGVGDYLPKLEPVFRHGRMTLRILERVKYRKNPDRTSYLKESSAYRRHILNAHQTLAKEKEKSEYFRHLAGYKYAWRGWHITSRAKKILKNLDAYSPMIDNLPDDVKAVRILNAGMGVIPIIFALVNKDVEVYAFEESLKDYKIATETGGLPANLHFIHPVWASDYEPEGIDFDMTIDLKDIGKK